MSITEIFGCFFLALVIPFVCAGSVFYHIFPRFAEEFASRVADHVRVSARVISTGKNGELAVKFRIEREKKTVIQGCRVFSPPFGKQRRIYSRGDRITVYYRDGGGCAEAVPENGNRWEFMYELFRRLCVIFYAAGAVSAVMCMILL